MRALLFIVSILFVQVVYSQDTTRVVADLNHLDNKTVSVKVYPPIAKNRWEYVIPEIVPGTYMKINYVRFYKKMKAFDVEGKELKVRRSKNVFRVSGDRAIHRLEYTVKPSHGDGKIWDNTLVCGGSAYNAESALINFQMLNGYFEGYVNRPFKIEVGKPAAFYGSSSIEKRVQDDSTDILMTGNYAALIDQPILYAKADTTSFMIGDNRFKIAVYAENSAVSADLLKPRFETIMHAIDTFSAFTTNEDYYFILYYADRDNLKGIFKDFGSGSALEHKHSSVYYEMDVIRDSSFTNYNWIAPHEYFHTITPLGLHSEMISDFNFREANMSRHVWMYEGVTDYFAFLVNAQSEQLNRSVSQDMAFATQSSIKRKHQIMTESGRNIIRKRNIVSWVRKVMDIMNFYEKGKLIAFAMDMELIERTNGERRLIDAILEMKRDYKDSYFPDDNLLSILEIYMYEGFEREFAPYIKGESIPPYEEYFEKLGWKFYPRKAKIPDYGNFRWYRDQQADRYYVSYSRKKNTLGLKMGDTLIRVNDQTIHEYFDNNEKGTYYHEVVYPKIGDSLNVTVKRDGKLLELSGQPKLVKVKYPKMKVNYYRFTEEQEKFREMFFEKEK